MSSLLLLFNYPPPAPRSYRDYNCVSQLLRPITSFMRSNFYWLYSKRHCLINGYFHPIHGFGVLLCSTLQLRQSWLRGVVQVADGGRRSESVGCVTTRCPLRWSETSPDWARPRRWRGEPEKEESHTTSSRVSHSDETLSLIVITTECQVSDSQPAHHANISVHSAEFNLSVTAFCFKFEPPQSSMT